MTEASKPIALVTGASRGIGAATAIALAATHHVILTARKEADLAAVEGKIHGRGGTATIAPFDLTDNDAIDRLAAAVGARWGRLDTLVLNAGMLPSLTPVPHIDPKDWDKTLALNLTANWRLIRAFDPWLRQSAAADVIAVTSSLGSKPKPYWGVYAASKAALESLIAIYGLEVGSITSIRTHIVDPGATRTAMRARAYPGENPSDVKPPEDAAAKIIAALAR
jgi:NAD(P)-dependent dehydrogenase (short-subunit alcohol dehydrogenase family)